jgi:hypothetical protein
MSDDSPDLSQAYELELKTCNKANSTIILRFAKFIKKMKKSVILIFKVFQMAIDFQKTEFHFIIYNKT